MKLENEIDSIKSQKSGPSSSLNEVVKEQINEIEKLRALVKTKNEEISILQKSKNKWFV